MSCLDSLVASNVNIPAQFLSLFMEIFLFLYVRLINTYYTYVDVVSCNSSEPSTATSLLSGFIVSRD